MAGSHVSTLKNCNHPLNLWDCTTVQSHTLQSTPLSFLTLQSYHAPLKIQHDNNM